MNVRPAPYYRRLMAAALARMSSRGTASTASTTTACAACRCILTAHGRARKRSP